MRCLCRTNSLSQDERLSYMYCVCLSQRRYCTRSSIQMFLQPYDRSILPSTTENQFRIPNSFRRENCLLQHYCYYMFKPLMRYTCSAAAECTVNVLSTLSSPTLSEWAQAREGFASAAASDEGFLANPIFSSEFLSFLQRW